MYPSLPGLTRQSIRRMMDGRIKSGHDDVMCREIMADKSGEQTIQYGVVPSAIRRPASIFPELISVIFAHPVCGSL